MFTDYMAAGTLKKKSPSGATRTLLDLNDELKKKAMDLIYDSKSGKWETKMKLGSCGPN